MRRAWAILPAILLFGVLLGVYVSRHHHCLYDDAFIYLRYVRNVHAGCGVRWNCDDPPVEGFSSPLHFGLLVVGAIFSTKLVFVSTVVGSLTLFATGALAAIAAGDSSRRRLIALVASLSVTALLALDHHVLLNAVIGMDSEIAALSVLATWFALDRRAYRAAAGLAVAGMLARPEPMVFAILLPLFVPARARRNVASVVVFGVVIITAVRFAMFHDVLPNTYWAKAGGTAGHVSIGIAYLVDVVRDFPIICVAPFALFERRRRAATAFALVGVGLWFAAFLRTGGDTFVYSRLAFPVVPLLTVLAFRGACAVFERLRRTLGVEAHWVAALLFAAVTTRAVVSHSTPEQHGFPNVTRWTATGRYLEKTFPKKTVATIPIGAIGYTSKLHVLDLVGLTSPPIAKAGRTVPPTSLTREWIAHERHNLEYVESQKPDVIVTTKFRDTPWETLDETTAGFYADWLVLRAIKEGRMPYHVADAEVIPGLHWLIFVRD